MKPCVLLFLSLLYAANDTKTFLILKKSQITCEKYRHAAVQVLLILDRRSTGSHANRNLLFWEHLSSIDENVVLLLGIRLRRLPNIKTTLSERSCLMDTYLQCLCVKLYIQPIETNCDYKNRTVYDWHWNVWGQEKQTTSTYTQVIKSGEIPSYPNWLDKQERKVWIYNQTWNCDVGPTSSLSVRVSSLDVRIRRL